MTRDDIKFLMDPRRTALYPCPRCGTVASTDPKFQCDECEARAEDSLAQEPLWGPL